VHFTFLTEFKAAHPETIAMSKSDDSEGSPALISNRTMEIVVALVLLAGSTVIMYDSLKLGIGWKPAEGPAPGAFPFYVGAALGLASLITLLQALRRSAGLDSTFVSRVAFGRVLAVLVPAMVYVAAIGGLHVGPLTVSGLGIYVASGLFILGFVLVLGREGIVRALAVSVGVPLVLYFMFERWFLVPLPKGPLEAAFGLG
jgi:hypothetical protein